RGKTSPPRSRRRWTQPPSRTCCPTSARVREPQRWVRKEVAAGDAVRSVRLDSVGMGPAKLTFARHRRQEKTQSADVEAEPEVDEDKANQFSDIQDFHMPEPGRGSADPWQETSDRNRDVAKDLFGAATIAIAAPGRQEGSAH